MATTDSSDAALQFLQKDYELKINYLSADFTRMWTRFNFFLVLESGLSVALFGSFSDEGGFSARATLIAWVGILTSLCWYALGAQDRHLVEVYRKHVEDAGRTIAAKLELQEYLGSNYIHVGDQSTEIKQKWYAYIYQWRSDPFSTTKLAAWFPLLVCLYWISMIVLLSKSSSAAGMPH